MSVKKTHRVYTSNPSLNSYVKIVHFSSSLPNLIVITLIIAGGVVATALTLFSLFFAFLLIPISFMAFKIWHRFKKPQASKIEDAIDAKFTVIDKTNKR